MKAVYLTAGAAGMLCGSCMHDNALAAALQRLGVDAMLVPLYTPIRTDEGNVSVDRVFFSGVSVFLQQKVPLFRYLPAFVDRLFESPSLLRWATSGSATMDYKELGALTVSMLQGTHGNQRREVEKLARWLAEEAPDVVCLSNVLIAGSVPAIREKRDACVVVTLQGDDVFLDELPEPYQSRAVAEIKRLVSSIDAFIVHSEFYGRKMSALFEIPPEKLHVIPLGLDTREFVALEPLRPTHPAGPRRIGYFARLAPEKGLHVLVDAFVELKRLPGTDDVELHVAGWLGEHRKAYADEQWKKLDAAGLAGAWKHHGELDRAGKLDFLRSLTLFSVPTTFEEPKGLYALEALALGVPVVLPAHGAFPEMLADVPGGALSRPGDARHLAETLHEALSDVERLIAWGDDGRAGTLARRNEAVMAQATKSLFERLLEARQAPCGGEPIDA